MFLEYTIFALSFLMLIDFPEPMEFVNPEMKFEYSVSCDLDNDAKLLMELNSSFS